MKKEKRVFEMAFIFAVLFAILACLSIGTVSATTTHYVNPGESIQGAIDNANSGDTIIVRDGTYTENVYVNVNHLTIKSENGYDSTIVQAENTSYDVFMVTADYVNIAGFTVTGATGEYKYGICLFKAEHCTLSDNNASNNYCGISLFSSSNNNTLMNNTANSNSDGGIYLFSSSNNNTLMNNTANSNSDKGIRLYSSCNNNTLMNNTANSNSDGGISLFSSSNNNTLMNNTANSNSGGGINLYSSCNNNTLMNNNANSNNVSGIYLYSSCNNNTLMNNTANSNSDGGISLFSSSNNTLMDNTANSNNKIGIYLFSSCNNNTLTNNTAEDNNFGICLLGSSNNLIYNNYFNNTNNVLDDGNNTWNITKTAGTNIICGPYIGGNYWSDYTGEDLNGDGLGDTQIPYAPYGKIKYGGDYLPLVNPSASSVFYTDAGTYPSIQGRHEGKIKSIRR